MITHASRLPIEQVRRVPQEFLAGDKVQPGHPLFGLVWINPTRVSGVPCFYGTRVPVQSLFDALAGGETVADFHEGFEGVTPEQVAAILHLAGEGLMRELGEM